MRILAISSIDPRKHSHGGAIRITKVLRYLAQLGNKVTCLGLTDGDEQETSENNLQYQSMKVRVHSNYQSKKSTFDIESAIQADQNVEVKTRIATLSNQADIVLCFQPYVMRFLPEKHPPVLLEMMDVEVEVKAHAFPEFPDIIQEVSSIEAEGLSKANKITTTTVGDKQLLVKLYNVPEDRIVIAPNATDICWPYQLPEVDRKEAKNKLNLPDDKPLALFFSSAHPPNVTVAKNIFYQIAPDCPSVNFLIAGSVSWELNDSPPDNVFLIKDVSIDQRDEIYRAADLGLNPVIEQYPASDIKVMDYLARAIPVVSTERGIRGHEMEAGTHYYPMDDSPSGAVWKVAHDNDLVGHLTYHGIELCKKRSWNATTEIIHHAAKSILAEKVRIGRNVKYCDRTSLFECNNGFEYAQSLPSELVFDLTNDCHLRCTHCYRTYMDNTPTYLPLDIFERIPDRFYRSARKIELSGMGEPMLHPKWNEILELIHDRSNARISFNTSLTIWNEEKLHRMVELGTSPAISIDAARKVTFERIRKRARHEKVFGGLRRLLEISREQNNKEFHPRVQWTLYNDNVNELAEFIEIAADMGVPEVRVQPIAPHQPEMQQWACDPSDPVITNHLIKSFQTAIDLGVSLSMHDTLRYSETLSVLQEKAYISSKSIGSQIPIHHHPDSTACSFPWSHMNIDSAGYVVACCFSDYRLGNLHEESLESIWNNQHFLKLRRDVNQPILCTYCVDSPSGGACCPRIQYLRTSKDKTHWLQEVANQNE